MKRSEIQIFVWNEAHNVIVPDRYTGPLKLLELQFVNSTFSYNFWSYKLGSCIQKFNKICLRFPQFFINICAKKIQVILLDKNTI